MNTVDQLRAGSLDPGAFDPIRIVLRDGDLYSLDNRRLAVFQMAGVDIPYQRVELDDFSSRWIAQRFTTDNSGESIRVRTPSGQPDSYWVNPRFE